MVARIAPAAPNRLVQRQLPSSRSCRRSTCRTAITTVSPPRITHTILCLRERIVRGGAKAWPAGIEGRSGDRYARGISSAVVVRVVVMLIVVAIVGGWLHLWWLALIYAAFWAYMIFRVQRGGSRQQ